MKTPGWIKPGLINPKLITALITVTMIGAAGIARAQDAPNFVVETYPSQAINAAVQEMNALGGPDAAISPKVRELIGLAVSAQIPCHYCIYFHTKAAYAFGASAAEVKEAIAQGAAVRKWSTVLNGSMYDMTTWRTEVDSMFAK